MTTHWGDRSRRDLVPLFFFERSFDMKIKVICAWCKKTIEVKEVDCESSESAVSHGICKKCKDKALEEVQTRNLRTKKGGDDYVEYPK